MVAWMRNILQRLIGPQFLAMFAADTEFLGHDVLLEEVCHRGGGENV